MSLRLDESLFVHGFPPSSVFRYLNRQSDDRILSLFLSSEATLFFVGHTHRLELVHEKQNVIVRDRLNVGMLRLEEGEKYIINAGSVGQPRDGDFRAKYLIWDNGARELQVVRVDYDYAITKEKIRALGFPDIYAARLG
jgi:diadenosine tetraphosphatase ApaH/serine/threonine PP2A family protein phosphatase